ncbi:hypothetical protein [Magnetofaba australis]|uniref:Lipoprotein n=1 Tax=Magnetofaba australis IT-1 TaxID=1434232 RepID=A0A1Y2JZU5_9PROT|nr:hypothetical protein [Magnetofaba australis]OSM00438.1 hypothetical protein MAIT1_00958 [Magnetofaba australis IT-1]
MLNKSVQFRLSAPVAALLMLGGCFDSGEKNEAGVWDPVQERVVYGDEAKEVKLDSAQEAAASDNDDIWDAFSRKLEAGKQAMGVVGEVMEQNPEALNVLRGDVSSADYQKLDKDFLKQKAEQLKGIASDAGIDSNYQPSDTERALLRGAGGALGVSESRMNALEQKANDNRERVQQEWERSR